MFLALLAEDVAWYGPATVTFPVQFSGDPFDPAVNDVRVRFIGDKKQREERIATFDPALGAWRATLYAKEGGSFRAVLVRNGKDALVEPVEGIIDLAYRAGLGLLPVKDRRVDRLALDNGTSWVAIGPDLASNPTPEKIDALADAGATWVRVATPSSPLTDEMLASFGAVMDRIERRGLSYTFVLPPTSDATWRRYALARYGASPRLLQWESAPDLADPWARATASSAEHWDALFENRPGPFIVDAADLPRIKALRAVTDRSGWADWKSPRVWLGEGAKGVGESDRLILLAKPNAKLTGIPLADGTYSLTTIDPTSGEVKVSETPVEHATFKAPIPGERFFVLRRKL